MERAEHLFTAEERDAVAAAVAEAERGTRAEIVPVVATVSGAYERAADLFGLATGLAGVAVLWAFQGIERTEAGWAPTFAPSIGLLPVLAVFLAGSLGGAWLASRAPVLQRPFLPAAVRRAQVERAARLAFQAFRVRRTAEGTGMVLYVSLFERMVCVLGDDAVAAELAAPDWESVRDAVLDGMARGDPAGGLRAGIATAGDLLKLRLPGRADDVDETHNTLRIL